MGLSIPSPPSLLGVPGVLSAFPCVLPATILLFDGQSEEEGGWDTIAGEIIGRRKRARRGWREALEYSGR